MSIAFVVAAAVLFIAVLPAEYGIDPLGTGRTLGLFDLYNQPPQRIVIPASPES